MSWIRNWKRACAGAVAKGMRTIEPRCGVGGLGNNDNACVSQGTDGTWYGAERTNATTWSYGSVAPEYAVSGQLTFALKWKADGEFVVRFGDAGNEKIPDTDIAVLRYLGYTMGLIWDDTNNYYSGNDLELATELIDNYVQGEEVCFYITIVPNLFISYDFDLMRGTAS